MTAPKEKDSKRRKRRDGCLASYERKRFLPRLSQTVERSKQDGGVGDVRQAFRQCCQGSIGKRSQQRLGGAHRTHPYQVEVITEIIGNSRTELQGLREKIKRYENAEK